MRQSWASPQRTAGQPLRGLPHTGSKVAAEHHAALHLDGQAHRPRLHLHGARLRLQQLANTRKRVVVTTVAVCGQVRAFGCCARRLQASRLHSAASAGAARSRAHAPAPGGCAAWTRGPGCGPVAASLRVPALRCCGSLPPAHRAARAAGEQDAPCHCVLLFLQQATIACCSGGSVGAAAHLVRVLHGYAGSKPAVQGLLLQQTVLDTHPEPLGNPPTWPTTTV
mgnify:CR=1 FL=1